LLDIKVDVARLYEVTPIMKNPLDSLWGTVICGVVLTIVFFYVAQWLVGHASGA
jgi:hypothetical protein